jgi:hypothetical protein
VTTTQAPPIHPHVEPLAELIGTWTGSGRGDYPTISAFSYAEEVRISHVGKPFLAYAQRTWSPVDGAPLHSESGYWRPQPDRSIEMVLAHPFGVVEISEGRIEWPEITVSSVALVATTTGSEVERIRRTLRLSRDRLTYTVDMAASGHPLQRHLEAALTRTR